MEKTIGGVRLAYTQQGVGAPVFLLHGWGSNGSLFAQTAELIAKKYSAICLDFPGFGGSPEPQTAWDVAQYAKLTQDFICSFGYKKVILLGHSFGGRVILKLMNFANLPFEVEKIILTGCAGIRHAPSQEAQRRIKAFKMGKKLLGLAPAKKLFPKALDALQKKYGSADYNAASPMMRQVLVKTVNEDLRNCMSALTMPTLLIWGENDDATPLEDGKEMERLMPGAGLAVIPNAGHYAFIDRSLHFNAVIKSFLRIE